MPGHSKPQNPLLHSAEYQDFAAVMDKHRYLWEAVKVKTEDGYTLTTFHVTGKIMEDGKHMARKMT